MSALLKPIKIGYYKNSRKGFLLKAFSGLRRIAGSVSLKKFIANIH